MKESKPIAYSSYGLKEKALLLTAYEKEMLLILYAVKKWGQNLLGRKFVNKTDQRSIKFLLAQRLRQGSQHKLSGFDFIVEY